MSGSKNMELDLKEYLKLFINTSRRIRKTLTILFIVIMTLSVLYFISVVVSPKYETSTLVKSTFITKNQLENYAEYINESISIKFENKFLPKNIIDILIQNKVVSVGFEQKQPDLTDPNKNDLYNYYTLNIVYGSKPNPENIDNIKLILDYIKNEEAKQNNIIGYKKNIEQSILEVDSLIKVAFIAGNELKNNMNRGGGSMMIVSDLYKNVNDIIVTKKSLENELFNYKTDNLIYQVTPTILKKKMKFPIIVIFLGFSIWLFISTVWVFLLILFGDNKSKK